MKFIPDEVNSSRGTVQIPYFEDASTEEHGVRGHTTDKSLSRLQAEIRTAVARLGGAVTQFMSGTFDGEPKRYGYLVRFTFHEHEGEIVIAALPIRDETATKKTQALRQALYTVHAVLEAQHNLLLLSPGSSPLLPYLLVDGERTVAKFYEERFSVPMLSAPIKVEGEVVE